MNLCQLVESVRNDCLDDKAKEYLWDDGFMLRSFTEAQRQACNRTNFIYDELQVTLVENSAIYDVPPEITQIVNLVFEGNVMDKASLASLDKWTPTWRTEAGMAGKTCRYAVMGNRIRFVPSPAAADGGLSVTIECYVQPSDVFTAMSNVPSIPEEFHRGLNNWVLYEALSKRDVDTFDIKAKEYLTLFNMEFGEYVPGQVRQHQLENGLPLTLLPFNYNGTPSRQAIPEENF